MRVEQKYNVRNSITRAILVAVAIVLQVWIIYELLVAVNEYAPWIEGLLRVATLATAIGINSEHKNAAFKTPWIILILALPVLGLLLYLMIGSSLPMTKMKRRFAVYNSELDRLMPQNPEDMKTLEAEDPELANQAHYLCSHAMYPVYRGTDVVYFSEASEGMKAQLKALREARKFIFMEYYAVEDREAFAPMKEILKEKASQGVEVRFFYDDIGSIRFLSKTFIREMEQAGIQCRDFNPLIPFLKVFMNNRDHRKMTIIDGVTGFTGGYNLADEYFNITHPFGYWKDTGVQISGAAVRSLTATFLMMWNASFPGNVRPGVLKYLEPSVPLPARQGMGWVQPYADTPLDREHTGENVYLNIINAAKRYVWISTPYLILSDEIVKALTLAARKGVDVRVLTPGIPDKKMIYDVTRSYYTPLVRGNVRIFEYTPGFNHAKMFVSDDVTATVGTFNLDFRSLYLHFEDGVLLHECPCIPQIRQDFEKMFGDSSEVTADYLRDAKLLKRIKRGLLRLFAPMF
ncbi:MAG: cardiolipin synthase [Lachnospiraceae bacterium]|jgi:cardiolipin synthase|nr:cardiolipin synthase [Lachnospiraceae bacterium]